MKNRIKKHRDLIAEKQGGRCCYCEVKLVQSTDRLGNGRVHPRAVTIEHLRRRADGGTGVLDNKAAACYECNTGRGSTDWLTYKSIRMGEVEMGQVNA